MASRTPYITSILLALCLASLWREGACFGLGVAIGKSSDGNTTAWPFDLTKRVLLGKPVKLTSGFGYIQQCAVSNDGSKAYVTTAYEAGVLVLSFEGGAAPKQSLLRVDSNLISNIQDIRLSPNGKLLALCGAGNGTAVQVIADLTTGVGTVIGVTLASSQCASIAFCSDSVVASTNLATDSTPAVVQSFVLQGGAWSPRAEYSWTTSGAFGGAPFHLACTPTYLIATQLLPSKIFSLRLPDLELVDALELPSGISLSSAIDVVSKKILVRNAESIAFVAFDLKTGRLGSSASTIEMICPGCGSNGAYPFGISGAAITVPSLGHLAFTGGNYSQLSALDMSPSFPKLLPTIDLKDRGATIGTVCVQAAFARTPPPKAAPPAPPAPPPPPPPAPPTTGLVPPDSDTLYQYFNPYFRYASYGYAPNSDGANWQLNTSVFWALPSDATWRARDQGHCASCWAFSAVAAVELGHKAASKARTPPDASEQQLVDCQGVDTCAGGWPGNALEYAAKRTAEGFGGLAAEAAYPYVGITSTPKKCNKTKEKAGKYGVTMWEQADFYGWFGLLLAVHNQPVIVNLQGSSPSFINFRGTGVYSGADCYTNVVDHTVLVVGFRLAAATPYWIIRNSWGPSWGDRGYMKLEMTGGAGVCGINTSPGTYPIVRGKDPCGPVNPCGAGRCRVVAGGKNRCACPSSFVAVNNLDGSQSCAPAHVCRFFLYNPCSVGTCVDDTRGSYTCICPRGFANGTKVTGAATCVPASVSTGPQFYTSQKGDTCYLIYSLYGLTLAQFLSQNPGLNCAPLKAGSRVNVTRPHSSSSSAAGCGLFYSLNVGDTCASVGARFKLGSNLTSLKALNPGLDCAKLSPGQQVCTAPGTYPERQYCTLLYNVREGDTCESIMRRYHLDAPTFFKYNPGVYCGNLVPGTGFGTAGQQVCVSAVPPGRIRCSKRVYSVRRGDSCAGIVYHKCRRSFKLFRDLNRRFDCVTSQLFVGLKVCVP